MKILAEPFRKIAAGTAAEICARVDLSKEAKAFLVSDLSPQGFLSLLMEAEAIGDAVRFLAFALPVREGVWWACTVAHNQAVEQKESEAACIRSAARWVYDSTDANRRACIMAAESSNFEGGAAYAALAAFWSGGSLAPEGMPEAPADPSLGHIGVGASVLLSITSGDPKTLPARFRMAMTRSVDIANGGNGRMEGDRPILRARNKTETL